MISIDFATFKNLSQIIESFGSTETKTRTAVVRALNKTALWLKAEASKKVTEQKGVQQKIIRNRLRIIKANRSALKAHVIASLFGIRASKLGSMRRTARGAWAGRYEFEKSFIAVMPTGYKSIFKRKSKTSLPISERTLPLEPMSSQIIKALVDTGARDKFNKYFQSELNFLLRAK